MVKTLGKPSTGSSRHVRSLATATLGLFMLGACAAGWAALRATLDRSTVQEGDTLTLSIESDAAQSSARPDLAPLRKDYEVLGTSVSSETNVVNGNRSDSTRWQVRLQPRHKGTLDIPSITVGSEHTAPLVLTVAEPSAQAASEASKHVFLEVEAAVAGKSIYVQQQIPYTVRLYYDDSVQTGDLAAPAPADALVEQLGEEKRYTAMRHGQRYNVVERHYAIAPEKSGTLHIPSASFRGDAVLASSRNGGADQGDDLMARMLRNTPLGNDSFFRNSLAGTFFAGAARPVAARGREITIDVQPRPAGAQGNWLPAEQITLHDSWDDRPPQFRVGEPVTRTITIDAKGLAASQIPPLTLVQPANARVYPEAPDNQSRTDGESIYGTSKQSVTYIPGAQGALDIPPVELAWWNTRSNAQVLAGLPAREFKVEPGAAGAQSNASPPPAGAAVSQSASAAKPVSADQPPQSASLTERLRNHRAWLGGAAALLALGIVSAFAIRRWRARGLKSGELSSGSDRAPRRRSAMRALRQACARNDRNAAAEALLDLARVEWPDAPPRGLGALAARLGAGAEEISALDRSLYGAGELRWEGGALWNAMRRGLQRKHGEPLREDDGLDALYL